MKKVLLIIILFFTCKCYGQTAFISRPCDTIHSIHYHTLEYRAVYKIQRGISTDTCKVCGWTYADLFHIVIDTAALLADGWQLPNDKLKKL